MRPAPLSVVRKACLAASCGALLAGAAWLPMAAARADTARDRAAVVGALEDSAASWSRNDLAGFMAVYEDAPSTTYVRGGAIVRGYAAIQAMYAARFAPSPARSGGMGRLTLDVLEVRPLGPEHALCIGRFRLTRPGPGAPPATGMFTLVFHRTPAGWKIAADHTSA